LQLSLYRTVEICYIELLTTNYSENDVRVVEQGLIHFTSSVAEPHNLHVALDLAPERQNDWVPVPIPLTWFLLRKIVKL
jgi:hypothetical protein